MKNLKKIPKRAICIITLGCAKNEVDSSLMEEKLISAGYHVVDTPHLADAVVVNTCCFIQEATEESLDAIFSIHEDLSAGKKNVPLIVAGCMPARYREALCEELSEASAFLPCSEEDNIVETVDSLLGVVHDSPCVDCRLLPQRVLKNCGPSRYVKISDGCDRFCSYCAIPYIRGSYHSFSLQEIEQRVKREVETGAREIVFIAQDTGRWGEDLVPSSNLSILLSHFADVYPSTWFRVLYTEPEGVTCELIDTIASRDNICSYFDIPLQHVDPYILSSMNRTGSAAEFLDLVNRIRSAIPEAVLRTTFIAGFPGETEEHFESLLDFLEDAEIDYVGVFPYSAEEGTNAALLGDQLDNQTKINRAQAIRDISDSISSSRIASRIGSKALVLIEGSEEDGQLFGRTQYQAPEVDGVTYIDSGIIGEFVHVVIEDTMFYEMEGTVN